MVRAVQPGLPLDYRILLAGYVPQFVYDRGAMAAGIPFEALRDRSHIRGKALSTDPDFSRMIRQGVPGPTSPVDLDSDVGRGVGRSSLSVAQ
jgi:hypothetical protein